jgi:hypothetical protein
MSNHHITHTTRRTQRRATAAALTLVVGMGAAGVPAAGARVPDTGPAPSGRPAHLHAPGGRPAHLPASAADLAPVQGSPSSRSSLDWGDAGIGAGGMGVVFLLAGSGVIAVSRRRRTTHGVPTA